MLGFFFNYFVLFEFLLVLEFVFFYFFVKSKSRKDGPIRDVFLRKFNVKELHLEKMSHFNCEICSKSELSINLRRGRRVRSSSTDCVECIWTRWW